MAQMSARQLLLELEAILPQAILKVKRIPNHNHSAETFYGGDEPPNITLDEYKTGLIRGAVHECLHIYMSDWIREKFDANLDEIIIAALEEYLCKKRVMTAAMANRWRRIIEQARQEDN